ncbi:MAG TPA: histidine kinase, partial [Ferruginibacter sp.]|nr:histidine kinase [Ferruginibacter sp.]
TETSNMINKLSGILKYIISECKMPLIPLEKEVKIICDYMELEKTRYSQYLKMTITIDPNLTGKAIAPLLLLPFVENCFKHGASKMISHSWITLNIYFEKNRL